LDNLKFMTTVGFFGFSGQLRAVARDDLPHDAHAGIFKGKLSAFG
jgi:hypothetical protein